jgi:uncharacterized protein DUF6894
MRFFFDYRTLDQSLYDYRGEYFNGPAGAIDYAMTVAEDLKHRLHENWKGWCVEVRNADGTRVFSIPVATADALAA